MRTAGRIRPGRSARDEIAVLDAFRERAWARAYLWSVGELDLHEAVDQLQRDAERDGLVGLIGQDSVQQIMADAFRPYRGGGDGR